MRPFVAGHLSSSTPSWSTSTRSTRSSTRSSARRSGCSASGRRSSRSPRWPTSRPAPAWARRAASRRRCSRRSTRTGGGCCIPSELAALACEIEIDRLGEPIGKQDQYIAAYGGITCFTFNPDDSVEARPLNARAWTPCSTSRTTCCCSSPASRAARLASSRDQKTRSEQSDDEMLENLHYVKELGLRSREALESGKTAPVRRADARALGAQEAPVGRHEQPQHRRVVRTRRARTARSAASWSAPAAAGS